MLRRETIADGERAHCPCPPGFGHHPAVAQDRARAISAAVKEHQHSRRVAGGSNRPFAGHAVEIDRLELDVVGNRPDRPDLVDAIAPLLPAHRPRLGAKKGADSVDFALGHGRSLFFNAVYFDARPLSLQPPARSPPGSPQHASQALALGQDRHELAEDDVRDPFVACFGEVDDVEIEVVVPLAVEVTGRVDERDVLFLAQ